MKRLLIILFCLPLIAIAQDKPLVAEGTSPNLYLNHTAGSKENYYSIGRMYNISPKEMVPYNNLTMDKGLSLGQTIKVPLTTGNFTQTATVAVGEVLVPVYHLVKDKESLSHISATYNKVPVATLKNWNNISGDGVSAGTNLIVGYLKVKKELSPLAAKAVSAPATGNENTITAEPVKEMPKPVEPVKPPAKKIINKEEVTKTVEKKEVQVRPEIQPEVKKETPVNAETTSTGSGFKNEFNKQTHGKEITKENGAAGTFKSTSGWDDAKYYCLYNAAAAGTIVKITNTTNGKSVYAKVLDVIPDIKQNTGLIVRLSNAATGELGTTDEKFDCTIEYSN